MSNTPTGIRGADLLAESLYQAGVTTIFGLPGDTGVAFYDALYKASDRIRHILTRDERHAASMADAYARVTNTVGVVEVSSGGGTTFVVGGLGESYASGIPVLLITSDIHSGSRGTGALTEIDQEALFSAVTKWQGRPRNAAEIPALVEEALRQAVSGRPAPVVLIIPEEVHDQYVENPDIPPTIATATRRERPAADPEAVARAAELLRNARRPIAIVGSGIHFSDAYGPLDRAAEHFGMAVATTIHGRGTITDDSPWSIGTVGNNGARPGTNEFAGRADVVLLVGTRSNATDTNSWTVPPRQGDVTVIQIDIEPERAGRNFPGSLGLAGDARTVLDQLVAAVPAADPESVAARKAETEQLRNGWFSSLRPVGEERASLTDLPADQLLPSDLIRICREVVGEAVVVADPGTPTPNVTVYWHLASQRRSVIIPRGHGPMGYAIPAAIGAAFATPGQPVVSFTADGSFAMACGELETAARFDLPILYVQLTNRSMGWIKMLQHLYTGRRYFGVDPGPIDAAAVARACGIRGEKASSLKDFRAIVEEFAANPRPTYVDVEVPHMIDYLPPVPAWHPTDSGTYERPVY